MKKPEILAPAGSMDALRAGGKCGSGCGLPWRFSFGARAYADNFEEA